MAKLVDQYGVPIDTSRLRNFEATPSLTGVRQIISGHPAEGLTPTRLAAIHRAAAQGDALAYLELAEDIEERDLHYLGVLSTRRRNVAQLPITVHSATDEARHVEHADFIRGWLRKGVLAGALFDLLDGIGKGFSVMEIDWETKPTRFLPRRLVYRPQRWFDFDDADGETVMLREGVTKEPLTPWKYVVHRHPSKSGLTIRSGIARVASWAWMFKAFTLKDWAMFVQNYGQPIRVGKYDKNASEEEKDVLWRAVANIAGDCAAIVPKEMLIEFVKLDGLNAAADLFERRADWMDRQVSKAVLGQTTTTDAVSGGHAVAREHRLVQEDIERADATQVSVTTNQQLIRPIIDLNFGPQPDEAYPTLLVGRPDQVPLKEVIEALDKLGPQGLTVEVSEMRDRLGFSEPGDGAQVIGGRPAGLGAALPETHQRRLLDGLLSLHASQPEQDIVGPLTARLARDAAGALAGLTAQVRQVLEDAPDLHTAAVRLSALELDRAAFTEAMARAMALAHLAGEAAVLDTLQSRTR